MEDCVVDDLDPARAVDQSDVKPHFCVLTRRFLGDEFAGRAIDPSHLPGCQAFGGNCEISRPFHFDKHDRIAVARDKIDFTRLPAPAAGRDGHALHPIMRRNLIFRGTATVIG